MKDALEITDKDIAIVPKRPLSQADEDALFAAVAEGDLGKLSKPQKLAYYARRCEQLSLNPLNQPFSWLVLNGKVTLYANRACTEELRATRHISIAITGRELLGDCYVVTAQAKMPDGRCDESTGAVPLPDTLKGEARANAMLKAETKAKRRVTLSICGLGLLDETEVASIPEVQRRLEKVAQAEIEEKYQHNIERAEQLPPPAEDESQEPTQLERELEASIAEVRAKKVEPTIDEATQKNLLAACKQRGVPKNDLRTYLKEQHGLDSMGQITLSVLTKTISWLEEVAPRG